jgi:hypothetical protein
MIKSDVMMDRPFVPQIDRNSMTEIADLFSNMRYNGAGCYLEAITAAFYCPSPSDTRESWLSPEASPLWLKAAEQDFLFGKTEEAFESLAKAAIFGSEETYRTAIEKLDSFEKRMSEAGRAMVPPQPQIEPAKLLRIVELYAEMNMHPRAIHIVETYKKELGDEAERQISLLKKGWAEIYDSWSFMTPKLAFYGQPVQSADDIPFIPLPESDEALKAVREALEGPLALSPPSTKPSAAPQSVP